MFNLFKNLRKRIFNVDEKPAFTCQVDASRNYVDIKSVFNTFDIKKNYYRRINGMKVNQEEFKQYYADLLAKREEARGVALLNKEQIVRGRLNEKLPEIEAEVEKELLEQADEPFVEQIALCERFIKEEEPATEDVETGSETEEEIVNEETLEA